MNLTAEQLEAVRQGQPLRFTDPETSCDYVVLRADVFEKVNTIITADDVDPEPLYPLLAELSLGGWEDPSAYGLPRKAP
jgi:hypothetical protein